MKNRLRYIAMLAVMLFPLISLAELSIDYVKEESGASSVTRPVIEGMPNTFVQDTINRAIEVDGQYERYAQTLQAIGATSASGLQVRSHAVLLGAQGKEILAIRIEVDGRVDGGRPTSYVQALMYDTTNGLPVTYQDIFADANDISDRMQESFEEALSSDSTGYLDPGAFFPLPTGNLLLDDWGITFFYDPEQFTLLSGRAGSLYLHYDEIAAFLNMQEGSLLERLGIKERLQPGPSTRDQIGNSVAMGELPGIPLTLGISAEEMLGQYPKAMDSESFPGGAKYQLEDDRFRGTQVIVSDGLLTGLISSRVNLYGLITGQTRLLQAQEVLGEAAAILPMDASLAALYGLPMGTLHDYAFGEGVLRLCFDEQGMMYSVWISRNFQNKQ